MHSTVLFSEAGSFLHLHHFWNSLEHISKGNFFLQFITHFTVNFNSLTVLNYLYLNC